MSKLRAGLSMELVLAVEQAKSYNIDKVLAAEISLWGRDPTPLKELLIPSEHRQIVKFMEWVNKNKETFNESNIDAKYEKFQKEKNMNKKAVATELTKIAKKLVCKDEEFDFDVLPDAISDTISPAALDKNLKAWDFKGFKVKGGSITVTGSKLNITIETPDGKELKFEVNCKKVK
jgi:hypothetical protein